MPRIAIFKIIFLILFGKLEKLAPCLAPGSRKKRTFKQLGEQPCLSFPLVGALRRRQESLHTPRGQSLPPELHFPH